MIELSVYNRSGKEVEKLSVDESVLGGAVRYALLKQAIVMYHLNQYVGTAATQSAPSGLSPSLRRAESCATPAAERAS